MKDVGICAEVYTSVLYAVKQAAFAGRIIPLLPHHIQILFLFFYIHSVVSPLC